MSRKPSWDDIPSLELSLEKSGSSERDIDKRNAVRIPSQDIVKIIPGITWGAYVQVITSKGALKERGELFDINQTGLCFVMPTHNLKMGDPIRIRIMLGKRPFQTNAIVRWVTDDRVGVEYVNPKPEDVDFLAGLYAAKVLNRVK